MSLQVREKMERQGAQVKKLEANHAHLVSRNNFRVLIFQVSQRSEVTAWPGSLLVERSSVTWIGAKNSLHVSCL